MGTNLSRQWTPRYTLLVSARRFKREGFRADEAIEAAIADFITKGINAASVEYYRSCSHVALLRLITEVKK